ncbi:MAG: class II aldolase/adducin family protein [Limnobacter sp.]|nr:class II aldolase/adducin family protein [Limnobacter sp.]
MTLSPQESEKEWQARVDLAAAYRLIALHGWDDLIFTHISARVPGQEDTFFINPYGMMFEEIRASSLVKVDMNGEKVEPSNYDVNPAGFTIHSAVHEVRHDAHCVMHTHTVAGVAVSVQEHGLLPLSQNSLLPISSLAYHDYEGIALREDEKARLQADLGEANNLILRNHGLLTCGATVADAFVNMFVLQKACEIQIAAMSTSSKLTHIPEPIVQGIKDAASQVTKGLGGQLAWPALLRKLDRIDPSYKT